MEARLLFEHKDDQSRTRCGAQIITHSLTLTITNPDPNLNAKWYDTKSDGGEHATATVDGHYLHLTRAITIDTLWSGFRCQSDEIVPAHVFCTRGHHCRKQVYRIYSTLQFYTIVHFLGENIIYYKSINNLTYCYTYYLQGRVASLVQLHCMGSAQRQTL